MQNCIQNIELTVTFRFKAYEKQWHMIIILVFMTLNFNNGFLYFIILQID